MLAIAAERRRVRLERQRAKEAAAEAEVQAKTHAARMAAKMAEEAAAAEAAAAAAKADAAAVEFAEKEAAKAKTAGTQKRLAMTQGAAKMIQRIARGRANRKQHELLLQTPVACVSILGAAGSGKTTLCELLLQDESLREAGVYLCHLSTGELLRRTVRKGRHPQGKYTRNGHLSLALDV